MKKLEKEQVRVVSTLAALLAGGGLVLMFCSPVFGTYLGEAWLSNQGHIEDMSGFTVVTKTYIHSFLITGSLLLAAGLFLGISIYMAALFCGVNQVERMADEETGKTPDAP